MTFEASLLEKTTLNLFDTIHPKIKKSLEKQGITAPTPIQEQSYEPITQGHDIIAKSRTGSGKTIAFALGAFSQIKNPGSKNPKILVLTPTRELADQVAKVFNDTFGALGFRTLAITGGKSYTFQKSVLSKGVDAIVATPGRFCDLLNQKSVSLENLEILILDEMDEMLDFGFSEDILKIKSLIGKKVQTLLFSATFPAKVETVVKQMVKNPVKISVSSHDVSTGKIEHEFIEARLGKNIDALLGLLICYNPEHAIIFCRTREETKSVSTTLSAQGFSVSVLNGEMSQRDRSETMNRFKNKSIRLLIATDVAARGIDVTGLSHVINLNVPSNTDTYTHRAGRTGRAGATGKSWTIVVYNQRREYQSICNESKFTPNRLNLPKPKEMMDSLLSNKLANIQLRASSNTSYFIKKAVEDYTNTLTAEKAFIILKDILQNEMQTQIGNFSGTENIVPSELTEFGYKIKFQEEIKKGFRGSGKRDRSNRFNQKSFSARKNHSKKEEHQSSSKVYGNKNRKSKFFKTTQKSQRVSSTWMG